MQTWKTDWFTQFTRLHEAFNSAEGTKNMNVHNAVCEWLEMIQL